MTAAFSNIANRPATGVGSVLNVTNRYLVYAYYIDGEGETRSS